MLLAATVAQAQITIAGNVYGGGKSGDLGGSTNVRIYAGDITGSVFGGARQADIAGCTYVNIDGANMTGNIVINRVYGGNDVSGSIGSLEAINSDKVKPDDRLDAGGHHSATTPTDEQHDHHGGLKDVSTFILTTPEWKDTIEEVTTQPYHIFIGQLFGSGNGDYEYTLNEDTKYWDVTVGNETIRKILKPEAARSYVDLHGGTFGYVYAGGNNASVTTSVNICVNNTSTSITKVSTKEADDDEEDVVVKSDRLLSMGINPNYYTNKFHFSRVFGGNNKAEMKISPSWHLTNGSIENLYSGGDEGPMTAPNGILLVVKPDSGGVLTVKNVFAGCRKAPVTPKSISSGESVIPETIDGYKFPRGLSARVLVYGGDITNVYGGNDITGKVTGGSAIGIYSSIKGCVYGGGNGSYAYTDNPGLKDSPLYGDFFYDVDKLLNKTEGWFAALTDDEKSLRSADALNLYRPNAEQVSLRLWGTEEKPTIIGGAVYIGGNSATLKPVKTDDYMIELKIGSHVISDSVFLANNGASMVTEDILSRYASTVTIGSKDYDYSKMNFTNVTVDNNDLDETGNGKNTFAKYMDGVVLEAGPQVVFDNKANGDPDTYSNYTTQFGSFYCGGNVGSMRNNATTTINVDYKVVIFDKFVGGSNKAYVAPVPKNKNDLSEGYLNVKYRGGLLGTPPSTGENKGVKLKLNLSGLKIQPKRWVDPTDKSKGLKWNTVSAGTGEEVEPVTTLVKDPGKDYETSDDNDMLRRLKGGNIYGGCYESGHVNGDVVININGSLVDRDGEFGVFDTVLGDTLGEAILYGHDEYHITERRSGVILDEQGMDVLGTALNVFGGGFGKNSEIWGNTTINLNRGYVFQIFGGSEEGVIGKSMEDNNIAVVADNPSTTDTNEQNFDYEFNGKHYTYNPAYSTIINVHGEVKGATKQIERGDSLSEAEFIYGGGFEGPIMGDTRINLGNCRVFNTFAGSCNADILGHTETYIGQWTEGTGVSQTTITGFPWVRDYTYGGNDLGGTIKGSKSFKERLSSTTLSKVYGYRAPTEATEEVPADPGNTDPEVLTASAYTEYKQGRVGGIFGGCYGDYDYEVKYKDVADANNLPYMDNAFVNVNPLADNVQNRGNYIGQVFGAGQGREGYREGDKVQNRSYVLIDIPNSTEKFKDAEVFGAGSRNGLGMRTELPYGDSGSDAASAIIDLISGQVSAAYGGSYNEGVTRRTVVNVPSESTIKIGNIFGGAYGTKILPPCDVYETNVNYNNTSEEARVTGAIYGGNNSERRALYTHVNITSPVWSDKDKGYLSTVFGAGKGVDTWSEYTEVNLEDGARVYEVYGGGQMGHVLNAESVNMYIQSYLDRPSDTIAVTDPKWSNPDLWLNGKVGGTDGKLLNEDIKADWKKDWRKAWQLGSYYDPGETFSENYVGNTKTDFTNVTARPELDEETAKLFKNKTKFNTHVIIKEGAVVEGYGYGGGLGVDSIPMSGDTYGTTYIALLGGQVKKDLYAAGTSGGVYNLFAAEGFTASANAYIEGGMLRNVYGGGWKGNVGKHTGDIVGGKYYAMAGSTTGDIPGETNVVIGIHKDKEATTTGYGFLKGNPAIMRNAYGGGEGGAVFGTANLTLRNGQIGYIHLDAGMVQDDMGAVVEGVVPPYDEEDEDAVTDPKVLYPARYEAKINDETYFNKMPPYNWKGKNSLEEAGCLFGGGYIDNSTVDSTNVTVYGGQIRNSLFGGGEIAAIGRGLVTVSTTNPSGRDLTGIYKAGKTNVYLYEGNINRNVFGGGRGTNNLGDHGNLDSDGFVFGQTEVHVYGGVVGTKAGVAKGDGNVFGGGDVGYVYSAYNKDGKVAYGKKSGVRYGEGAGNEGYYYKYENNAFVTGYPLTEDCKVLIEPHAKVVNSSVEIKDSTFTVGQYVPTSYLNTLSAKNGDDAEKWANIDASGIIIHNAVFAGGNTSAGSSTSNANTASVFGNATASIHDVYHRDLITLGTGHTGGLYGDGNLTLVDGYRELNITNYGTDYYTIEKEITIGQYNDLPDREAAYYELRYTCLKKCQDKDGTVYKPADPDNVNSKASTITRDDLLTLFLEVDSESPLGYKSVKYNDVYVLTYDDEEGWIPNPNVVEGVPHPFWKESGVLPVYAGRLMNSIQRADFCGVFGSRMVMQGARDRVPEITDFTNYTINRVREVSLNQQHSVIGNESTGDLKLKTGKTKATKFPEDQDPDDFAYLDKATHGNYFGIYNIVNFLGGLTSDVHFKPGTIAQGGEDRRRTDNIDKDTYGPEKQKDGNGNVIYEEDGVTPKLVGDDLTYFQWKEKHKKDRTRNNGTSFNKVALASGVYLELTTEKSTGKELNEKVWGYITGIVELDLINVQTGIGGGFVYAKNEHRVGRASSESQVTLTALNNGAISRKNFVYDGDIKEFETSGNFVHSTQTIIDDCYNISGKYEGDDAVPAHYWYIKGSVYVYDQYISAYTGAPNAYSETVEIPLTIAAASHGTMKLLDVKPNRYAYKASQNVVLEKDKKLIINDVTYYKNDPISYWDWYLLSPSERSLFVEKTYVTTAECKWSAEATDVIVADSVFLPETYSSLKLAHPKVYHVGLKKMVDFDFVFRESNNLSHDTGYILTYKVNNPSSWNTWYTEDNDDHDKNGTIVKAHEKNQTGGSGYEDGPTYYLNTSGDGAVLGQQKYEVGDLISQDVEVEYQKILANDKAASWKAVHVTDESTKDQATFEPAYMVTNKAGISSKNWNYGYAMKASEVADKDGEGNYNIVKSDYAGSVAPAYICTSTIQMDKTEFIYLNSTMSLTDKTGYVNRVNSQMDAISTGASSWTKEQINASSLTKDQKNMLLSLLVLKQDIDKYIQPAYYCTALGSYGGKWYSKGVNYRGLEAWSSMSYDDRNNFTFNYDALDLLIDPTYSRAERIKYQYDHPLEDLTDYYDDSDVTNPAGYSITQPVDYTATYNGSDTDEVDDTDPEHLQYYMNTASGKVYRGDELQREAYESLPNEQRHYTGIVVKDGKLVSGEYKVYVTNKSFQIGNTPYSVGTVIPPDNYTSDMSSSVTELSFPSGDANKIYYYCREEYEVVDNPVRSITDVCYYNGQKVPVGTIIEANDNKVKTYGYNGLSDATKTNYSSFTVGEGGGTVYIVSTEFTVGETSYTVGSTMTSGVYDALSADNKSHVTVLSFSSEEVGTYGYCKESYTVSGEPVKSIKGDNHNSYGKGATVPVGAIIGPNIITDGLTHYGYSNLPNLQKNFTIHGISPTETSTLYVSRQSDIYDLSKEKIITAIYQYDYEESDTYGNTTPVSERHVVNIHITFKSGVPEVEDINAPQLVLPGSKVGLREPNVTPGAYEVTGGGWELFRNSTDAESHVNGKEFNQATDSLFWYQNDYYVAYYAKTYLGKTYSNHVPVSVANYHDLKKVMEAKQHHYYIDHKDVSREPKIYINNYSKDKTGSNNGLDLLKSLYDLSVLNNPTVDTNGLISSGDFAGHRPLESKVRGGDFLEFILRTNIDHSGSTWTPIGTAGTTADPCLNSFSGMLHGDGYYLSGLDHSLFGNLCGQVYNLGVMGNFVGTGDYAADAGIAETGKGYVENCWISNANTGAKHSKPVFGNPTRNTTDDGTDLLQVVNCYYQEEASNVTNPYTNTADADHGNATRMSAQSFYNGEVAYDLNGFYLKKRYYHGIDYKDTGKSYKYLTANADGTLPTELSTGWYPNEYACYPINAEKEADKEIYGYVENRFNHGDYIYADGVIPDDMDGRIRTVTETSGDKTYYAPIWPDDYIYFGQTLSYGHDESRTHQDVPSHIAKSSDRLDLAETGNRVYRAPAYFRNSNMGVAHFNPYAVFAATKKTDKSVKAYENMTAIDFTGKNDVTQTYQQEVITEAPYSNLKNGAFYPPLLDDGGVKGFLNGDLTKNLLAYTYVDTRDGHAKDACNVTDSTIATALGEIAYKEGDATGADGVYVAGKAAYRTVDYSDPQYIQGHWVRKSGDNYVAQRDHQLVDKQDFNAPIAYQFANDKRMWYQRIPDNFAGQKKDTDANGNAVFSQDAGWESISLPFTAALVTTNLKGEITHFYKKPESTSYNEKYDIGHEYWLREFADIKTVEKDNVTTAIADFNYPDASGENRNVTNTFLWDYYYKASAGHNQQDKNRDTYQTYYNSTRTYDNYPLLQRATPYIIGFPGELYYEFDLSGGFDASSTTATYMTQLPIKLSKQTITFASNPGVEIMVSDEEMELKKVQKTYSNANYYFYPNYLNIEMPVGGYVMSKDGDAYNKMTADDVTAKNNKVSAFRTYFSTLAKPQQAARRIIFNSNNALLGDSDNEIQDKIGEGMDIRPGKRSIIVTSNLKQTADVRIFNISGLCVASFNIEPGQTIETPIHTDGVYVVHADGSRYRTKLGVK